VSETISPHGGRLVDRRVPAADVAEFTREALGLRHRHVLSVRQSCDLEMIGSGAYSPLEGFLTRADYTSVVEEMRLASGALWSVPITLPVDEEVARALRTGDRIALVDEDGAVAGTVEVQEVYPYDKAKEAQNVFKTTDPAHPGVAALEKQPPYLVGGPVRVVHRRANTPYADYELAPRETRAAFAARGWKTVVGFQTRNPVHRAHEYLQKVALEVVDGLLLHPLVGETKSDDIPADVRFRCYEALLENYYPAQRVLLAAMPASMRYAGPREAVLHAIARQNYGCTHFIVGRDHAGVGKYYGTYEAQETFDRLPPGSLKINIFKFENTFYCQKCRSMASSKTCPHGVENHLSLSGTKVREMLRAGELPPPEFSRPEVARILVESMKGA
jgi:sulfate adenylyltransferase